MCVFIQIQGKKIWNEPLLWNWFDPDLVEQIITIPIPRSDISDIRVWFGNPLAQCSETNAYAFIEQHFEWRPRATVADAECFFNIGVNKIRISV